MRKIVLKYPIIIGGITIAFVLVSFLLTIFKPIVRAWPIIKSPIIYSLLVFTGIAAIMATALTVFEQLQKRAVRVILGFIKSELLQSWIIKFILFMFLFLLGLLGYSWLIPNPFNHT